jgi:hypothetical protein
VDEPDVVSFGKTHVKAASSGSDHDKKIGHSGQWCFRDDDTIRPFGPVTVATLFPAYVCKSCKSGASQLYTIPIGPGRGPSGLAELTASVCPDCVGRVRDLLAVAPADCSTATA